MRRTIETIASRGMVGSLLRVSSPKRYAGSKDSGACAGRLWVAALAVEAILMSAS